jgi:hypothetical protein
MMVLYLVHEHIVKMGVPKMKDDGISVINDLSHSLNICNSVVLFEGFGCSGESNFSCCEYSDKIAGGISID